MKSLVLLLVILLVQVIGLDTAAAAEPAGDGGASPEDIVAKIEREYEGAFNKGDASTLATLYAEDVEFTDADGVLTRGRDAVRSLLQLNFVRNPGARLDIKVESVRRLGDGVLVERGTTQVTSRDGEIDSSAYTIVYARQADGWRISQLVESPVPDPSPGEMLSQLAWMVGTWNEVDGDAKIETKVDWAKGGNFLTRNFKVTVKDEVTLQGWQIIGWDASESVIRSWMFDSEGGFTEGTWTPSNDGWLIRQVGVLPDGGKYSADNTLARAGENRCTWESTNRTLDGDPQPSLPPVEMIRAGVQ